MNKELVVSVKANGTKWIVQEDFHFIMDDFQVIVPKGFETDFASTPTIVDSILGYKFKYSKANVVHDYLYATKLYSREISDNIYYKALIHLGIDKYKSYIAYKAVRLFGHSRYVKEVKDEFI